MASNGDEQLRDIDELIDRSSLGSPGAHTLRARTSDEQVARVLRRVRDMSDQDNSTEEQQ